MIITLSSNSLVTFVPNVISFEAKKSVVIYVRRNITATVKFYYSCSTAAAACGKFNWSRTSERTPGQKIVPGKFVYKDFFSIVNQGGVCSWQPSSRDELWRRSYGIVLKSILLWSKI